ncbi:MAG: XdhC family protein [Anaerolineaceae bacterium]|nr:XdhC family protein [Anaerolineaceae bacterium]
MNLLLQDLVVLLKQSESIALATIVTSNGSAPRTAGAQMIVRNDGSILGTIGGGQLEAQVLKTAAQVFQTRSCEVKEFHFTGKDAASMDMICGGRQEILLEYLDGSKSTIKEFYDEMLTCIQRRQKVWKITAVPGTEADPMARSWLVKSDGSILENGASADFLHFETPFVVETSSHADGLLDLNLSGVQVNLANLHNPQVIETAGAGRFLVEPADNYGTVFIFGAGHVSQKLALLTEMVGFRTVILDDRPEFANRQRFMHADEIIVLENFKNAFTGLDIDSDSSLIIVTRGHLNDAVVLEQALKTRAGYVGMIGSKRKREMVYQELADRGTSTAALQTVHSPIGLPIGADSPEEIAVSITAELIQERVKRSAEIAGFNSLKK